MTKGLLISLTAAGMTLGSCNESAHPAPEQKAVVSSSSAPTSQPLAVIPDGSAANTGNRANGEQAPTGHK